MEYKRSNRIPQITLPLFATVASNTTSTGVAQGEENMPPSTPAISAPIYPLFVLLAIKCVDGKKLYSSKVCNAIKTINMPSSMYHKEEDVPISFPSNEAIDPSAVNVIAIPTEKVMDKRNAFFVSFPPVPPTYPITSGTLDNEQGVNDVSTPAKSASTGANHILLFMMSDKLSSIPSVNSLPPTHETPLKSAPSSFHLDVL